MDETGQPDNEPVEVGDETSPAAPGGWQPPSNGAARDVNGSRSDGLRRGLRTADTPWSSAGAALEPAVEPATSGWRRSLTSGLRGRAEVRSRYADLLAPVSPALPPTPPRTGEAPASAPPYPCEAEADADHQRSAPWTSPAERAPAERPAQSPYSQFRPPTALTDNTFDDLPALAQAAAASQAAHAAANAASAVQAARAAEAEAAARAVVEDHAAVEAAYRAAQGGTGTPDPESDGPEPPGPAVYRAPVAPADPRVPGNRPAEFRAPGLPAALPGAPRPSAGPTHLTAVPARIHSPAEAAARALEAARVLDPPRPLVEPVRGGAIPLPQRIPAPPDVPDVPEPEDEPDDPFAELPGPMPLATSGVAPPELARIATHLRYDEGAEEEPAGRPDPFDVNTVLAAVRDVPGVRDAQLRPNPGGVHTLRLDLADGADPGQVSRMVARLLKLKMGLAAEPRRQTQNRPTGPPANIPRDPGIPKDAVIPGLPATRPPEPPTRPVESTSAQVDERTRHRVTPVRIREGHGEGEGRRAARPGPRVVIDQVQVSTLGLDATVEVRLTSNGAPAYGVASGPAADGYVLRLAAVAATNAIDQLLSSAEGGERQGRSFVEHAAVVPFGSCEVAVVVLLLVYGGTIEQLTGSALVAGDPRQAVVRATMAAVNRRLDTLLS